MANMTVTTGANFIPEQWSMEIIASHLANKALAGLLRTIPTMKKKGDQIHIPKPSRATATQKVAGTDVVYTADTADELVVLLNQHWYSAKVFEDFATWLAMPSMLQFYTQDLGESLAQKVDTYFHALGANLGGGDTTEGSAYSKAVIAGDGSTAWDPSADTNQGNGTAFTDIGFRSALQALEDADVPLELSFVAPPVAINVIRGIDRYNSRDFVNAGRVVRGEIGEVYGVRIVTSTNCATVVADNGTTEYRAGLLLHRDAMVYAEVQRIRVQKQDDVDVLGTKVVSDVAFGGRVYRPENGITMIMPK